MMNARLDGIDWGHRLCVQLNPRLESNKEEKRRLMGCRLTLLAGRRTPAPVFKLQVNTRVRGLASLVTRGRHPQAHTDQHPAGNLETNRTFPKSTPVRLYHESGHIRIGLTQEIIDLPSSCLQGGLSQTSRPHVPACRGIPPSGRVVLQGPGSRVQGSLMR